MSSPRAVDPTPIAVTGSIATDHLMTFAGRFTDQLLPDQLDRLSVSFLVEDLEIRRGGVAANICYGLGQLGLHPVLVGAVGADFDDYRSWLDRHGVDTASVHVSELKHTARFVVTSDVDDRQIASFYPGAMSEAREIELAPLVGRVGDLEIVVVSPNDPAAMLRHTQECRDRGIPFAADPSQQLAFLPGEQISELIDGAAYLFGNGYELALIKSKTGLSDDDLLARVHVRVTTHGADGVVIDGRDLEPVTVPPVPVRRKADPTGAGDAFRSGFLAARLSGLSLERSAQLGNVVAIAALETVGPQEYSLAGGGFTERFTAAYGPDAAAEVAHLLPA